MTMNARPSLLIPLAALLAGCGSPGAIFVTKSSLAIADIDSTPAEMSIAMHRVEGFVAPRNRNGNTPPVLAHINSNRAYLYPQVEQVYATGTAAERLAGDFESNNSECENCGRDKKVTPVVFTTSTTLGFRIGVSTDNIVDGLVLGYRRKEMSFVPVLAQDDDGSYRYPSLIAAIRINQTENGKFSSCQGFATGTAASKLAEFNDKGLGCLREDKSVKQLLTSRQAPELRQQAEIVRTLRCYTGLSGERKHAVRGHADMLGFAHVAGGQMLPARSGGDVKTYVEEDGRYARQLVGAILAVDDPDKDAAGATSAMLRERMLRLHREFACLKAKE
jgi:hypothetical protein